MRKKEIISFPFIQKELIENAFLSYKNNLPFDHCVVDGFLNFDIAERIEEEFLEYESEEWYCYKNAIEDKKALNNWNLFPKTTYQLFSYLNSKDFVSMLSKWVGVKLFPDPGLNGGGWHCHGQGGNLNPHLDYSIHPKLGLQRKVNIIIYISKELKPEHGGYLGLYEQSSNEKKPGKLIQEVIPIFNRAVIFDTTQNSWHGMSKGLSQPKGIYRKSLAIYYLCKAPKNVDQRGKALFSARADQENDASIEKLIKLRSSLQTSKQVYKQ